MSYTNLRKNVIHWYPMQKKSKVLQIGGLSTELLEELCNKVENVVMLVDTMQQKEEILESIQNDNVEIKVVPNLNFQEEDTEQYDYVTLLGSLEFYQATLEKKAYKRLDKLLQIAKQKCKEKGKILATIPNKYGMKYWTTLDSQKNILCNDKIALSKEMIYTLLEKNGLLHYKYYYMLPDHEMTNVIFTDSYLPNTESIHRNFTYGEEEFSNFNITEAYGEILKEDKKLFPFYVNSYFLEIGKEPLEENTIQFVSYTNIRKEEYQIQTIIYQDRVEKTQNNEKAKEHIVRIKKNIDKMNEIGLKTLDTYEEDKILSRYVQNAKTYDKVLLEYLEKEQKEEFFEKIENYKQDLLQKLEEVKFEQVRENNIFQKYGMTCQESMLKNFHFVKNGLWDLIFQNIFYLEENLYFYDQEWYEENVPIEYILYRAIAYFINAHAYIPTEQLYATLHLTEYVATFQELDNKLQETIRDATMWKKHQRTQTGQTLLNLYHNLQEEFAQYKQENKAEEEFLAEIAEIKRQNKELENRIHTLEETNQKIITSTSWKITKPIRWLGKNIKK